MKDDDENVIDFRKKFDDIKPFDLQSECMLLAPDCIQVLYDIISDKSALDCDKIEACRTLLAYGWGEV